MIRACAFLVLVCLAPDAGFGQQHPQEALVGGRVYVSPGQPPLEEVYRPPQRSERAAIDRLREIQQELIKAWLSEDRPIIERFLAPDWAVTGPTGVTSPRAQILADAFERRVHRVLSGTVTDVSIRLVGSDAAVVTGRTQATGTYNGAPYAADIRFTDVFERHGTDWRAVRSHASTIARQ